MNYFDLKGYLAENKLTTNSRLLENEKGKIGTYKITSTPNKYNGEYYVELYLDFDENGGWNRKWGDDTMGNYMIMSSKDRKIFTQRIQTKKWRDIFNSFPSVKLGENENMSVSLEDIESKFVLVNKSNNTKIKPNNSYVKWDREEEIYVLNSQKIGSYLKQFNNEEVRASVFMNDEEGFYGEDMYIDDVEKKTDSEIEDVARQAMSFYFYSDGDSI